MQQPTLGELMRMIQRLDNKLNWLIRKKYKEIHPDGGGSPGPLCNFWATFDPLPEQPKDFFTNPKEKIRLRCGMSKAHCDKQKGVLNKKPETYKDYNEAQNG